MPWFRLCDWSYPFKKGNGVAEDIPPKGGIMNVLVTGGAGYIGSITAQLFCEKGYQVTVLDNLSTGLRESVPEKARFIHGDVLDQELLEQILKENQIEAVVHFAAKLVVPESVENPGLYYENNVVGGLRLLEACRKSKVKQIIFSSTAAVYGNPPEVPVTEESPIAPINPYGASKAMVEQFLKDYDRAYGIRFVSLRYFNVAGATANLLQGQKTKNATHLFKVVMEAATGKRESVSIFGTDYPTKDGSGIRDYIHVVDLAQAHLDALAYLTKGGLSQVFNCGYGHGFTVREVIEKVKAVSGSSFRVVEAPRRVGDSAAVIADSTKARTLLGWQPRFDNLELICRSAYEWELKQ